MWLKAGKRAWCSDSLGMWDVEHGPAKGRGFGYTRDSPLAWRLPLEG